VFEAWLIAQIEDDPELATLRVKNYEVE
jgi:hypothetical protein